MPSRPSSQSHAPCHGGGLFCDRMSTASRPDRRTRIRRLAEAGGPAVRVPAPKTLRSALHAMLTTRRPAGETRPGCRLPVIGVMRKPQSSGKTKGQQRPRNCPHASVPVDRGSRGDRSVGQFALWKDTKACGHSRPDRGKIGRQRGSF